MQYIDMPGVEGGPMKPQKQTSDQKKIDEEKWGQTGRVGRLQDPICFFGVSNNLIVPFDDQMAGSLFEQRRAGEVVHVHLGFGRHFAGVGDESSALMLG